jgi:uncharacterized membrane protein YhaH (DUF805 family)
MAETRRYHVARRFWILSIANWALAVITWSVSAYLGGSRPESMLLYSIIFVIGAFAVLVGIAGFVVARFGREPAE